MRDESLNGSIQHSQTLANVEKQQLHQTTHLTQRKSIRQKMTIVERDT
jgi:hypothetical protein